MENNAVTGSNNAPVHKIKFSEVLNEAWNLTGKKLWNVLGAYILMLVVLVVSALAYVAVSALILLVFSFFHVAALTAIIGSILLLGLIILALWVTSSQLVAIYRLLEDDQQTVLSAVKGSWSVGKTILPTVLVVSLVTLGGYIAFVIPGIVMAISLSFVAIIAILEGKTMWPALIRSRDLVRGNWWNVFGQMLGLTILSIAAILVTGAQVSPLSLILAPVYYVYSYVLYKKLVSIETQKTVSARGDWYYKLAAVVGALIMVGGVLLGSFAIASNWDKIKEAFKEKGQQQYYEDMNDYDFENVEPMGNYYYQMDEQMGIPAEPMSR